MLIKFLNENNNVNTNVQICETIKRTLKNDYGWVDRKYGPKSVLCKC